MGETTGDQHLARLLVACDDAIARLQAKEDSGINPDVFVELGEALFWMAALIEARGKRREPLMAALLWARNRVAHGVLVVAPVGWHYGSDLGRLVVGSAVLGTRSHHTWADRHAIPLGADERPAAD